MTLKDDLQAVLDSYAAAYCAGDAAACAALFTKDASLASPFGPIAQGRAQIERTHADWLAAPSDNKQMQIHEAGRSQALAWCLAGYSEGDIVEGLTLAVLKRGKDGPWRIRCCSLTEALPDTA